MTEHGTSTRTEAVSLQDRVRAVVDEVIAGTPVFVVDLTIRGGAGSRVVDVYLDGEEALAIGTLAEMSREIGFLLETADLIRGRYHLNVSSPGADRPLREPRQFPKHIGRPLRVLVAGDSPDPSVVEGSLARVDSGAIVLRLSDGAELPVPFDAIKEARVQLPW